MAAEHDPGEDGKEQSDLSGARYAIGGAAIAFLLAAIGFAFLSYGLAIGFLIGALWLFWASGEPVRMSRLKFRSPMTFDATMPVDHWRAFRISAISAVALSLALSVILGGSIYVYSRMTTGAVQEAGTQNLATNVGSEPPTGAPANPLSGLSASPGAPGQTANSLTIPMTLGHLASLTDRQVAKLKSFLKAARGKGYSIRIERDSSCLLCSLGEIENVFKDSGWDVSEAEPSLGAVLGLSGFSLQCPLGHILDHSENLIVYAFGEAQIPLHVETRLLMNGPQECILHVGLGL